MLLPESTLTLSVIIVSYNTAELTLKAVQSVIKNIQASPGLQQNSEIIVVDNDSSDNTVSLLTKLQTEHEFLSIIANDENLGFARANNLAINQSRGDYILLLNSDAQAAPGSLLHLVHSFEKNPINNSTAALTSHQGKLDHLGILAAGLLNPDGSIQPQGGRLPTLLTLAVTLFCLDDIPLIGRLLPAVQETGRSARFKLSSTDQLQQKGWVAGTAMCIRRQVFEEIGLLDENFFMYGEDMEFCLRAKNHHWDIAIDPQAQVIHVGSASPHSTAIAAKKPDADAKISSQQQDEVSEAAILGEIKGFLYIWAKHKPDWQTYFVKMLLYFAIKFRIIVFASIVKDKKRKRIYQKAKKIIK